ncbi:hypothetical protein PS6_011839, partial [Mucor atramentarius]
KVQMQKAILRIITIHERRSETSGCPYYMLCGVTRLADAYGSDYATISKIIWCESDGYKSLYYNNKQVSIDGLSRFALALQDEAMGLLRDKLLLGANIPCLGNPDNEDMTRYNDQMSSDGVGYSLINDPANEILHRDSTMHYIILQILSNEDLKQRFGFINGRLTNILALDQWLKVATKFVKLPALATHILAGQPARGTELCATTIVNNNKSGIRGVFWTYHRIMLVQYYNKSRKVFGDKCAEVVPSLPSRHNQIKRHL